MEAIKNYGAVSVYQNFRSIGVEDLTNLLLAIRSDKHQSKINSIRYALHKGDKESAETLKKELDAFTASGIFDGARSQANLKSHSGFVCLDFDDIPREELDNVKSKVCSSPSTFGAFISPTGTGIKVFVKVEPDSSKHLEIYIAVSKFYESLVGYDCDPKCKDITRLCFVSHDEDCYINLHATAFIPTPKNDSKLANNDQLLEEALEKCLKFTERQNEYRKGNRNNFIFQFASNANRRGISLEHTMDFCVSTFDLGEKEITDTVKNVYRNHFAEFAKFAKSANSANLDEDVLESDMNFTVKQGICSTPLIPEWIYSTLPELIRNGTDVFDDARQKDLFLTASLTVLSGCMPNIKGLYFQKIVFANLYSFVVAPPASNKGALTFAKDLAKTYHQETVKTSKAEREKYEQELKWYYAEKRSRENDTILEQPIEPPLKVVLIPGNASTAAIYMHLQMNGGSGIICETEADTMAQAFKQEWGSYSYIMRQAFHHESISSTRKSNQEYVEIDEPKLSIALTGTPNQVKGIIPSAEDGLFSRFIFYSFESTSVWNDPSPKAGCMNLTEHFRSLSIKTNELVKFYQNTNVYFELTQSQWGKLNQAFDKYLSEVGLFVEGNADSVVKRHGLILYRICMILSAIRHFETSREITTIVCLNQDFDTALALIDVYIQHSVAVFGNLPKQREDVVFEMGSKKRAFFEALPSVFSRKEAVGLAKTFGIAERTADSFLKIATGKFLTHSDYGLYSKL